VGEYGGTTKRPHYHAILFNATEDQVELAWKKGSVYFGDVNDNSIGYTLKYLNKQSRIGLLGDDDRHPQFTLSSNGLGISYITKNMIKYHYSDLHNRNYIQLPGGCKARMPRYYYEKIYGGYERDLLKMSGSLILQDQFYQEFYSKSYDQRIADINLFEKRVQAAERRHNYLHSKTLTL